MNKYAIVTGQGRSGTNWVLDVLDASRETICRNEPNVVPGSPFGQLAPLWRMVDEQQTLDAHWDAVAEQTCSSLSIRDHRLLVNKDYLHSWAHRAGLPPLMARPKARSVLARTVLPGLRDPIWTLPRILGNQKRMAEAYGVIKVNRVPLLVEWLLANRGDVPVVNIVRHPGGRHASYLRRFLAESDADHELEVERSALRQIAADDGTWAERFGDIESLGHTAVQTWIWRFTNETIAEVGQNRPMYKQIVFEQMALAPLDHAREIYELFGLDWTSEVEDNVTRGIRSSVFGSVDPDKVAGAWRERLDSVDIDLIDEILAPSPLAHLWV